MKATWLLWALGALSTAVGVLGGANPLLVTEPRAARCGPNGRVGR